MSNIEHQQLLASLNQNKNALNDLLRHYAHVVEATDICITSLTATTLTLQYKHESVSRKTVDISLPPSKSSLPTRLSALTTNALESRIPALQFPHTPYTYLLLILLLLEAIICLAQPHHLPTPLDKALDVMHQKLLLLFQTHQSLRLFFFFTLIVHLLEGLYAITLIRRAVGHASFGGTRIILWGTQTAIVGFPSLFLLMDLLAESNPPQMEKSRS